MASAVGLIFTGIFCQILPVIFSQQQPIAQVEQGQIRGRTVPFENDYLNLQKNIDVFLGIPYAEPPIGDYRFAPPLPKTPWSEDDVYDATYNRSVCVQTDAEADLYTQSEDCLHLNVYAPNPKPNNAAVMVWIHGGSYTTGNGYQGFYGGHVLSAVGDVIIVTMNYRLSTFGFLSTGDDAAPGNFGLLDQVEALRWVKTNINAFGGDPNRITIFGESSGATSVSAHLISPLSDQLFQQAILQSGSALDDYSFHESLEDQRKVAFQIGAAVGCEEDTTHELIYCMRQVDAQALNDAAYQAGFYSAHVVDNNFLTEEPQVSAANGRFQKVPLMIGFNQDEGTLFTRYSFTDNYNTPDPPYISKERFQSELAYLLPYYNRYSNQFIENAIQQEYVDWAKTDNPAADYLEEWNDIQTDFYFSCPAILEARYHVMADDHPVYMYVFTHTPTISIYTSYTDPTVTPGWLGATHGEELHFMFGYPFDPAPWLASHEYSEEERQLAYQMIRYWTNFAKTGNPNMDSTTTPPYTDHLAWPQYTIPGLQYQQLSPNITTSSGFKADECHFWNEFLREIETYTGSLAEVERQWREDLYQWKFTDIAEWREAFDEYKDAVKAKVEL